MKGDIEVEQRETSVSVQRIQQQVKKPLAKPSKLEESVGSTLTKTVMGQDVTFTLVKVPADKIAKATMVWLDNERDQDLLDEHSVADLSPSFSENGQEVPAFGRDECGIIQVSDGSRRRTTGIVTESDFYIWVGDLSNEQMSYLSEIGNTYMPTSSYEKGARYARLLKNATQDEVANMIGIDRKAIMRCVHTSQLPKPFIKSFKSPNDLSARKGQALYKMFSSLDEEQQEQISGFFEQWCADKGKYSTDELVDMFIAKCGKKKEKTEPVKQKELAMGATVTMKKNTAIFNVPKISDKSLEAIEAFIEKTLSEEALKNC
jgi:ParB family transcriptional regulator, chromosome partitioning protein